MKHLRNLFLLAAVAFGTFACGNDEEEEPIITAPRGTRELTNSTDSETFTEIRGNRRLSRDTIYLMREFLYVTNGATLTIEPGTIIKGESRGTLIIEKGARIDAQGTATAPIVFTSNRAAGQRAPGDWGGVVIIGRAAHNRPASTPFEGNIRGTFGTDNTANDNSGTLRYVRIEYGGIPLTGVDGFEINGLTMYGVGSGTTLEYIQVTAARDDAFEWFGGAVNAKYLVAHRNLDDDFDTDWGYSGKVQFALSLRDPNYADQSTSNGFESDNFSGSGVGGNSTAVPPVPPSLNNGLPLTSATFANVSVFVTNGTPSIVTTPGGGRYQAGMHLRRNTTQSVLNSVFVGYPIGLLLDGVPTLGNTTGTGDGRPLELRGVILANTGISGDANNASIKGAGGVTDEQATAFFNTTGRGNQIVAAANLSTLVNAQSFNLTAPVFTPPTGSALLSGANWEGKGADAFFEKVTFRGAVGPTNWLQGWTNFDPQNTPYTVQ